MNNIINEALMNEANVRDCRILFAVESGSRAWGFASQDSDYDVRVVYVKSLNSYLHIDDGAKDTWEAMLPNDLDISAWDIRKALCHLLKSNASFLEWLQSPIVYQGDCFIEKLKPFVEKIFNPLHVSFHYAAMFRHALEGMDDEGFISVKKLCYALRASCAVRWIVANETMPPTEFVRILDGIDLTSSELTAIDELLFVKADAKEGTKIRPPAAFSMLLQDKYDELSSHSWNKTSKNLVSIREELNELFRCELF